METSDINWCSRHKPPGDRNCADCFEQEKIVPEDKSNRPRISTLPVDPLYKIAQVFQWVIKNGKYKEDDWRKGISWKENYNSLQRHAMDYYKGVDIDPETGEPTLAQLGCRVLMALEMQLKGTGTDDRYKEK